MHALVRSVLLFTGGVPLAAVPAQQVLRTLSSLDFYWNYTPLGDVDSDGYEDVLVTSATPGPWSSAFNYELRVYSGRDASLIRTGPSWSYPDGGYAYAHGDQDHDGVRDYICWDRDSSIATQRLRVRSGLDDHIIWTVQHPTSLSWAQHVIGNLDLNGDGELDVVVSHSVGSPWGRIWAYNHQGNLLYQRAGPILTPQFFTIAQSLARLGDVNGDGCDDYITGLGDPTWYGGVAVLSGPTGQTLRIVTGQGYPDYIGLGCVGCGDLDGDGVPDFAAGGGLSGTNGSVQAFSGATGTPLFVYYSGLIADGLGTVLETGDYDQDGIPDILAPSWSGFRVISGREGVQIAHFLPSTTNHGTFRTLALATPHGFPNVLLQSQVNGTFLMTSQPRRSRVLGPGCNIAGPTGPAPRAGMRELNGADRRLTLSGAAPGSIAFLLLGHATNSPGPISLTPIGLPQCNLYPNLEVLGGFTTGQAGATAGFTRHDFPGASLPLGIALDAQWLTLDANFNFAGLTQGIRFARD